MNLQEPQSFMRKMLGDTVGFIVFAVLFAVYFPVFIAYLIANAVSMGIFSMLTGGQSHKDRGGLWWIFPAIPTVVLIGGAIVWTVFIGSTFFGVHSKVVPLRVETDQYRMPDMTRPRNENFLPTPQRRVAEQHSSVGDLLEAQASRRRNIMGKPIGSVN
jgi:hypothetical protein